MNVATILDMFSRTAEATVLVLATLFPIVNPIGSAAVFLSMVGTLEDGLQRRLARRITFYSYCLLVVSMIVGGKILSFFGISLYAVQMGGGLVVAASGWQLLTKDAKKDEQAAANPDEVLAQAFFPYTLPITVGPGSISVAIALGAHLPSQLHATGFFSPLVLIASLVGSALVCAIVYICYRWARNAARMLGSTGMVVLMRLSSFILFCIGVQILATGLRSFLFTIHLH